MTEEMMKKLMAAGLNKAQASSQTAETLVNLFMDKDAKILIEEARAQVNQMKAEVFALKSMGNSMVSTIENAAGTIKAIAEAQNEYGTVCDERAKNAVSLYGTIVHIGKQAGANPSNAVLQAGYIVYAYLASDRLDDIRCMADQQPDEPSEQSENCPARRI